MFGAAWCEHASVSWDFSGYEQEVVRREIGKEQR